MDTKQLRSILDRASVALADEFKGEQGERVVNAVEMVLTGAVRLYDEATQEKTTIHENAAVVSEHPSKDWSWEEIAQWLYRKHPQTFPMSTWRKILAEPNDYTYSLSDRLSHFGYW